MIQYIGVDKFSLLAFFLFTKIQDPNFDKMPTPAAESFYSSQNVPQEFSIEHATTCQVENKIPKQKIAFGQKSHAKN